MYVQVRDHSERFWIVSRSPNIEVYFYLSNSPFIYIYIYYDLLLVPTHGGILCPPREFHLCSARICWMHIRWVLKFFSDGISSVYLQHWAYYRLYYFHSLDFLFFPSESIDISARLDSRESRSQRKHCGRLRWCMGGHFGATPNVSMVVLRVRPMCIKSILVWCGTLSTGGWSARENFRGVSHHSSSYIFAYYVLCISLLLFCHTCACVFNIYNVYICVRR